jgi:hypothetical protein
MAFLIGEKCQKKCKFCGDVAKYNLHFKLSLSFEYPTISARISSLSYNDPAQSKILKVIDRLKSKYKYGIFIDDTERVEVRQLYNELPQLLLNAYSCYQCIINKVGHIDQTHWNYNDDGYVFYIK